MDASPLIHVARFADLQPHELYGILKLRSDVFIVEQNCAYDDIDGRDAEPTTQHLWVEGDNSTVIAALRLLRNRDGAYHIGRVATHSAHRGHGLAGALMRHAMSLGAPPIEIKAQAHLAKWYSMFGFVPYDAEFVEDGIPHQRMRIDA